MPLWTHKVLVIPFLPVGLCISTILLGLLCRRRWLSGLGATLLTLSSMNVVSDRILGSLEHAYAPIRVENCTSADAIVVLGGSVRTESPAGALEWNESSDRFQRGIELFRAGKAPFVVFTAARIRWRPGITEGALLRDEALRRGLTQEQVVVPEALVENTAGEAETIRQLMTRRGWKRIILVTSAFHMRRSMRLMRGAGVEALPFPCDYQARRQAPLEMMDFLPQAEPLLKTERAVREWIGILFYAARGK
ncbi:YdcF family protein [uncultured Paludibaculum sp.]|uniref:YdcF family protein n=1 Tax=uncultured Paludibaculum sp. TaxID=1765020 RepID=UPI002AABAE5E|nr:YdcF family protein [uncultured Paludibaculum sp.]